MKKLVLIFYFHLFFINVLCASQPFDAIINLGGNCQVAYQMQLNGLRKYALPFDKLITPYDGLQKLLENNFEGLLEPDNFELVITQNAKYVLDKKYGTRWIHDFKLEVDFLKDYESVRETYQRRIERFLKVIKESENPLFIRKTVTKEQVLALKKVLDGIRGGKPYTILALDGTQEMKFDWQLEGIKNFYLRQPTPYTWKGDDVAWQEIFTALRLSLTSDNTPLFIRKDVEESLNFL